MTRKSRDDEDEEELDSGRPEWPATRRKVEDYSPDPADWLAPHHMSATETSLRLARWLLAQKLVVSDIDVALTGHELTRRNTPCFPVERFLAERAVTRLDGLINRRRALAVELRQRHMIPIATFARARLHGVPDFAALTSSGSRLMLGRVVAAARAMATAAMPHLDALVSGGFPPDTITQLVAAADAVSSAMAERAGTHVRRVGATKGIEEQLRRGREAVAVLKAVVGKQAAGDLVMLASWRVAHRVTAKSGTTRVAAANTATAQQAA